MFNDNSIDQAEFDRLKMENSRLRLAIKKIHKHLKTPLIEIKCVESPTVMAQVICRSPTAWENLLWINVGETTNHELNELIVAKNSPVLFGNSIIGVIDYVGKRQSRVRLVTDPSLSPAVRVVREMGTKQHYLAKGFLQGKSNSGTSKEGVLLRGSGFNYDFNDIHGPARDMRDSSFPPLVREGDLLITSGLDGIFPEGLDVARVSKISVLKEGDYFFELDACSTAGFLDNLTTLVVMAPLGFDSDDHP